MKLIKHITYVSFTYYFLRHPFFYFGKHSYNKVIFMDCMLCGKKLENEDFELCDSCLDFLIWKYDSLENYEKVHKEVNK